MKCRVCGQNKNETDFSWKNKAKGIKNTACKSCQHVISKNHYEANKNDYITRARQRDILEAVWYKELKSQYTCVACPETDSSCIDFHHLDETEKYSEVSTMFRRGFSRTSILEEINKCVALCANCHRKLHAGNTKIIALVSALASNELKR